ncbi:MAG: hypothetical protein AAF702_02075 [Chloroflexota bacterium]
MELDRTIKRREFLCGLLSCMVALAGFTASKPARASSLRAADSQDIDNLEDYGQSVYGQGYYGTGNYGEDAYGQSEVALGSLKANTQIMLPFVTE